MPTKQAIPEAKQEIPLEEALKKLAELSKRMEEYENEKAAKEQVIQAQAAEIRELKAQEEGWLVKTPSAAYNETLYGLKFTNGLAFIPRTRAFPQFTFQPLNDEQKERYLAGFKTPEKRAKAEEELKKAEARTTAEIAAHQFRYDWGFEVEWIGADRLDFVQTTATARAREAALEQKRIKEEFDRASELLRPSLIGKIG